MPTDPVCFMVLDEENTRFKSTYRDTDYYFCCEYCKKQFDANPRRYTRIASDLHIDTVSC